LHATQGLDHWAIPPTWLLLFNFCFL
jgi:hypothetical protein